MGVDFRASSEIMHHKWEKWKNKGWVMKMHYLYEPLSYTNTGELYGYVSADLSPIGTAQ